MIFAGISLVLFVTESTKQYQIKEQNENIVLENLREEIRYNLVFINELQNGEQRAKETLEFPGNRFRYYYGLQSSYIIEDYSTRVALIRSMGVMQVLNDGMDFFSKNFIAFPNDESREGYEKLRRERINSIYETLPSLKIYLETIRNSI